MSASASGRRLGGLTVAVAIGFAGLNVPGAQAGTYRAAGCEVEVGALTPETASFTGATAENGWAGAGCSSATQPYLFVGADANSIWLPPQGSHAEWTISAPPGLRFRGGFFQAFPSGVAARYQYRVEGQTVPTSSPPINSPGWYSWPASTAGDVPIDELVLQAVCVDKCLYDPSKGGAPPGLNARYFGFEVEDYAQPAIGALGGALIEGAAQRGTQLLAVPATDSGGGIADVEVRVNGKRYANRDPGCMLAADGRALRLSPCPTTPTVQLPVDTTSPLFSEGPNAVEVCVSDYAQESDDPTSFAGESCVPATVYVDNSCDVSVAPDAAGVRFGFGRRGREHLTVRYGKRARAVAEFTDAGGEPIEGATVCVSAKDRLDGASEVDLGELVTNQRGKAKVKLPKGASRRVKLSYWRDEENVQIEILRLDVRARPKLRVLSKRKLSDGGRVRFRVKIGGPYRKGRKVAVQALAPAGWLDFPGCSGKTNERGVFRCSYRFREQSGNVAYKFRALAPRQAGYPYLQGRTKAQKVLVRD